MERELNGAEVHPEAAEPEAAPPPELLEVAHVLFMDLVSFSIQPMEEQRRLIGELQQIVRNAPQVREAERDDRLISIPTGDGMALVFFGGPLACVQSAVDISVALKASDLKLRMGINTGPVYCVTDINGKRNVSGGGINTAQRIMDAGDAGHILVSKGTADILQQLKEWAPQLHDLGLHAVKHDVKLQFFNLWSSEAGNPLLPSKFRQRSVAAMRLRILLALACAIAAAVGYYVFREMRIARRSAVAVLGFRNITARAEADWVSTDLADGLRTELASTGKMRMTSGEESAEMWKDLGLSRLDTLSKDSLERLHSRGADYVIVGSYTDLQGGRIHLNIAIQDTAAGETMDSIVADGTEVEISRLVVEAGQRLRIKLGLGQISPEKERQIALAQPSPEAAPTYSEGLASLRAYEPLKARSFLERAIIVDSAFPYAHAALAEALFILGYDSKAKEQAKQAFDLSGNLSFEDKTSIEGRYRGIASDWPAAIAAYQRLAAYSPQNLEYGLKLAEAQRSGGKGRDGLVTLAALRKLAKPEGDDPRIDLEEAETAASLGDLKRGLAVAGVAVQKAKTTGARLLESRSLTWSCEAQRRVGQMDQARQSCEQARQIAMDLADDLDTARAVNGLANIANDQGDLEGAGRLFEQALALGRKIGDQRDVSGALNNIGGVLTAQGRLTDAKERFLEARKIQEDIGFKAEMPKTLSNLGNVLDLQGDLAGSQREFEQAIALGRETGNESAEADGKANLGMVLVELGALRQAELNLRDALKLEQKLGAKSTAAVILDSLADLQVLKDDLQEAERSYREALAIQQGMSEKGAAAVSTTGLATVLLERGQASEAENMLRPVVEALHSAKDAPDEGTARVVLAQALLAQKKFAQAQKEMGFIDAIVTTESQRILRYKALTTAASLRAAAGGESNVAAAIDSLQKISLEARKFQIPVSELEARLAIAEIQATRGNRSVDDNALGALVREAQVKGFLLIAQKGIHLEK